jgi:hypothetical protein
VVTAWCGTVLEIFPPSSWESQEEGMMNIAARFSLSKKPRFVDQERKKPIRLRASLFGLLGAFHENKSVVWNKDLGCAFGFYQSRSVSRIQEKARRRGASRAFPSQTEEVLLFGHIVLIIYCNLPSESPTRGCARSFRPDRQKTNRKRTVRPFPVEHVPVRRPPASFAARSSQLAARRVRVPVRTRAI